MQVREISWPRARTDAFEFIFPMASATWQLQCVPHSMSLEDIDVLACGAVRAKLPISTRFYLAHFGMPKEAVLDIWSHVVNKGFQYKCSPTIFLQFLFFIKTYPPSLDVAANQCGLHPITMIKHLRSAAKFLLKVLPEVCL